METLWTFISNHKHRLLQVDQIFFLSFGNGPDVGVFGWMASGSALLYVCMCVCMYIYIYTDSDNYASSELQSIAHTSHHFQTFEISKTMSISSFITCTSFSVSVTNDDWHVLTCFDQRFDQRINGCSVTGGDLLPLVGCWPCEGAPLDWSARCEWPGGACQQHLDCAKMDGI